jgi:ubiquinone/menaquinone biosynthesis C-methylase UbiE
MTAKYDRDRVARIFDEIADAASGADYQISGNGNSIPEICGAVAYDELGLTADDVLLDVGTGKGVRALAAAKKCRQVVGIDISKRSIEVARAEAARRNIDNVVFAYGAFEDPSAELDLSVYPINKILAVYSLHHLPDSMKEESISALARMLDRPGRIVIGDIIFFGDPEDHFGKFDEVHFDGGDTDFPSTVDFLSRCIERAGGIAVVEEIHPLAGVIAGEFS